MNKKLTIFGPFAGEYSLARVNRNLAFALRREVRKQSLDIEVMVSATVEQIGLLPSNESMREYPGLEDMYKSMEEIGESDILIFNNFPRNPEAALGLGQLPAKQKLAYLAWEESKFPAKWVAEYNENLTAVFAASTHTKWVLEQSGVNVPIVVVPNALTPEFLGIDAGKNGRAQSKEFTFLHVSSGMPRKGPAELLAAFDQAFSASDNVKLIIKSFPNADNMFPELLAQRQGAAFPKIEFIEDELSEQELVELFQQADCFVSPSKAEGFNIPVLEAMALRIPVITTGWSGQLDFANRFTSMLADYDLQAAQGHNVNPGALWAEPDVSDLAEKMQQVAASSVSQKVDLAFEVAQQYSWNASAKLALQIVQKIIKLPNDKVMPKLGVISTFNSDCGIAEYSNYLYGKLNHFFPEIQFVSNQDAEVHDPQIEEQVVRLWRYGETDFQQFFDWLDHAQDAPDAFHIQYNLWFYPLAALAQLIIGLKEREKSIFLTPHAVNSESKEWQSIVSALSEVNTIQVHSQKALQHLQSLGLENVELFQHGGTSFPSLMQSKFRNDFALDTYTPIVAVHGFLTENKGFFETLEAISMLKEDYPDILLLALTATTENNMQSQTLKAKFEKQISRLDLTENVLLITDFLSKEQILTSLAVADLAVFAYKQMPESASGSIRLALAAGLPIVTTKSDQLSDLSAATLTIDDNAPANISAAINHLLSDEKLQLHLARKAKHYSILNCWDRVALDYVINLFS